MTTVIDDLIAPPDEDDSLSPPEDDDSAVAIAGALQGQLVELLPADFPLPALIKFAPDSRMRAEADVDATKLLGMIVTDETTQRVVEACLTRQREHKATIEALFREPCAIANNLHKHLTGLRGEWLSRTEQAIDQVNRRLLEHQRKVEREAAEARRRAQEEADRQAREQARLEAEAAKKADAPATVVQQLEFEAQTAKAPPVSHAAYGGGGLRTSTVTENWKARLTDTESSAETLQPEMAHLSATELACVKRAMQAVLDGKNPIGIFEINWSWVNARAKADKKTFALEGFVAEDLGSLRAKPGARRK